MDIPERYIKTCLITGGNSGIGFQAAILFAKEGFNVIIAARNRLRGEKAVKLIKEKSGNENVQLLEIDLSSQNPIRQAAEVILHKVDKLDVLIHNAADFDITREKPEYSADGIEKIWATNHIGPVLLTELLLGIIQKSAQGRIITVASKGLAMYPNLKICLDDPEFKHHNYSVQKAYYQSKLAQVMYTYYLAERLKNTLVTVNCIRVPAVKINLARFPDISVMKKFIYSIKSKFAITPEEMAKTYLWLGASDDLKGVSGKYFNENHEEVKSSRYSYSKEAIELLMNLTNNYIHKN